MNDRGFKIIEGKSKNHNLMLKGFDSLNLHHRYLHLIMINRKFEIIYKKDHVKFDIYSLRKKDITFLDLFKKYKVKYSNES
jgi:hypothetical protein